MTMRTRFAPSPTGYLHIGGARTALFCALHARKHKGVFALRIEDTDRERSTQEAVAAILEGMRWMGLDYDEGPYYQARHTEQHLAAARRLLETGKAYRCYCTKEELDAMRDAQRARKEKPRYDGRCRNRSDHPEGMPHVIRFKSPSDGETVWTDQIQGTIRIQNKELDDLILVRSDGSPTYNLAVVVDDHDMGITHVIRGEDHLSNAPRQITLFEALGWPVPIFAHMPLLHGEDGAKLSKRHGAVSVLQYRDDGFLPEALNNYLVRLGWSHGEKEFFTREEMIELFDITDVGRSAAIFNASKLLWLNGHHMRQSTPERLSEPLMYQLGRMGFTNLDPAFIQAIIPGMQERTKTLKEMAEMARFYFSDTVEPYDTKAMHKHFKPAVLAPFIALVAALEALPDWTLESMPPPFKQVMDQHSIGMGKLAQPVRIALTGSDISPGVYEILHLLGREQSLVRLRRCVEIFRQAAAAA
jgi:glutamyl-tRNA synthetase